ncbi:MAG: metallophosphoesterase [Promethearchaeota archaeon]
MIKREKKMKKFAPLILIVVNVGALVFLTFAFSENIYYNSIRGPYLSWSNSTGIFNLSSTSISISWRSNLNESGKVEYGIAPGQLTSVKEDGTPSIQHSFFLSGLQPNTTYYYRVGNGRLHSPTFYFTTLEEDPESIRFCVYGDTRPPDSRNREVIQAMSKRNPQFWLHVGDIVGSGGELSQWKTYLAEMRGLGERSAFMPVIGNHEYYGESSGEPENFFEIFALPGDESTFAFEVGDVLFIAINTRESGIWEDGHSVDPVEWAWVNDTLSQHYDDYKWIVLYTHYPPYSSNGVRSQVTNDILPLAENYDVDIVFTGHVHNYERFDVPNSVVNTSNIPYFVTGGGGAPLTDLRDTPTTFSEAYESQYQYMYCEANSTHIYTECVDIDGNVLDNWTVSLKDRTNLTSYW